MVGLAPGATSVPWPGLSVTEAPVRRPVTSTVPSIPRTAVLAGRISTVHSVERAEATASSVWTAKLPKPACWTAARTIPASSENSAPVRLPAGADRVLGYRHPAVRPGGQGAVVIEPEGDAGGCGGFHHVAGEHGGSRQQGGAHGVAEHGGAAFLPDHPPDRLAVGRHGRQRQRPAVSASTSRVENRPSLPMPQPSAILACSLAGFWLCHGGYLVQRLF